MDHCENALCTLLQKHEWNSIWKSFNEGHFNTFYPILTLFFISLKKKELFHVSSLKGTELAIVVVILFITWCKSMNKIQFENLLTGLFNARERKNI